MSWSAKIHGNLTLEQNGPSQDALRATFGPWVGYLGPIEATIFWAGHFRVWAPSYSGSLVRIYIVCECSLILYSLCDGVTI